MGEKGKTGTGRVEDQPPKDDGTTVGSTVTGPTTTGTTTTGTTETPPEDGEKGNGG